MLRATADKNCLCGVLLAVFVAFAGGCGGGNGPDADLSNNSSAVREGDQQRPRTPRNISDQDIYSGNWQGGSGGGQVNAAPPTPDSAQPPRSDGGSTPAAAHLPVESSGPRGVYSLVLGTFTESNHLEAAQRMISEMRNIAPAVRGLRIHPTTKGSMVVYGNYSDREDPSARRDIDALKAMKYQGRQVFPRVILTYLDLRGLQDELNPNDLHAARRAHPRVNPLYTLDVAMWDDFDSGQLSYEEIRRKAEAYTTQLRIQGYEAYFYHDDVNQRSVVTVGLFDRTAINSTSGLYTSNVTDLIRKFPQRLVNGEPMFEYQDKYANKRKKDNVKLKPQTPVLVLVPDM